MRVLLSLSILALFALPGSVQAQTTPPNFTGYAPRLPASPPSEPTLYFPSPSPAYLRVQVPANAEIWIDGEKTQQTGADRYFVSPPVDPYKVYRYDVRARWNENGRDVEVTRRVRVVAGQTSSVSLLTGDTVK